MYKIKQYKSFEKNKTISNFVKANHYLGTLSRGNKFVFAIYDGRKLKGIAAFGTPVGRNVQTKYGGLVLELKRFVLKDCEANTASWFIGQCIKKLKLLKSVTMIITYADPKAGHVGTIYKAANFKYEGMQKYQTRIVKYKGKEHHLRAVYQKSKIGLEMQALIKQGKLASEGLPKKHIFTFKVGK